MNYLDSVEKIAKQKNKKSNFLPGYENIVNSGERSLKILNKLKTKDKEKPQSFIKSVDHSEGHSVSHSEGHSVDHSSHSEGHSVDHSEGHSEIDKPLMKTNKFIEKYQKNKTSNLSNYLTQIQQKILQSLIKEGGITNYKRLSEYSGVTILSTRSCVRSFKNKKIISNTERFKQGEFQGFSYTLNKKILNDTFLFSHSEGHSVDHSASHSENTYKSNNIFNIDDLSSSSNNIYNKKTTANTEKEILAKTLEKDPEFAFWREKNLSLKQVISWINEFGCSAELMLEYLKYCRFEMVNLKYEEKKRIDKVFNWFYKIMQRSGSYPKPKEYKSHKEILFEREKELIEQKKKEAQKEIEIYQQKIQAEKDKKFWEMMNNKKGECYKKCFDLLNPVQKNSKGMVFEEGMKGVFEEIFYK